MNEFVIAYPSVIIWILGALSGLVLYFVKQSVDRLTAAIVSLQASIDRGHSDIGLLKERMTTMETTYKVLQGMMFPLNSKTTENIKQASDHQQLQGAL